MKLHNAINIIYRSLVAYIEDSAGQGSEEAKEIDKAYSLVNSKVSKSIHIHDIGMVASVMAHEMFDKIYEHDNEGVMSVHSDISAWALEFHQEYEGKVVDWGDEDELKSLGFKNSQCWDEAIIEFVENKLG
jgi:hypothetical protein